MTDIEVGAAVHHRWDPGYFGTVHEITSTRVLVRDYTRGSHGHPVNGQYMFWWAFSSDIVVTGAPAPAPDTRPGLCPESIDSDAYREFMRGL